MFRKLFPPPIADDAPERRTRRELIDPALEACGWTGLLVERELHFASDIDQSRNFVDYALFTTETHSSPIALLEAKHDGLPPDYGLEQVKLYADRAQANIRFVFASNGIAYVGFDRLTQQKSVCKPIAEFPSPHKLMAMLAMGQKYTDPPFVANKLPVPKSQLDRGSEQDARAVIENIYPNSDLRNLCLRFFAESIKYAHEFGSGKWEVTLGSKGHFIRLNVGAIEVCALSRNQVHLILDDDTFTRSNRYAAGRLSDIRERTVYTHVPASMSCDFLASTLSEVKPFIWTTYQSLIAKSAATVKTRTGYYVYHSSGIMDYLRREIDSTLPNPDFSGK